VPGAYPVRDCRAATTTGRGLQPRARQLTSSALGGVVSEEAFLPQVKRLIVGAPIPSQLAHHGRFSRVTGLAVLSSDALSSVAYATEEILRVLTIGGSRGRVRAR